MANLYTYACSPCGFTGVFREDNSLHCPLCRTWPMKEVTAGDVDAMLATMHAVHGLDDEDIENMAAEMADKATRRAVQS